MKARLSRYASSPFLRGVAALSGAQMTATLIPLLAAPVIGRLYTPAEYGPLAAYMAFAGILGPLGSLSFDKAIVAERTEKGARAMVGITIAVSLAVAFTVLLVVIPVLIFRPHESGSVWLWFFSLPLSVVLTSIGYAGTEFAVRMGRFKLIGMRVIAVAVVPVVVTIACGVAGFGANGPIIGYLVGQIGNVMMTLRFFEGIGKQDIMPSPRRVRTLVRRHRDFAFFTTPGLVLVNIALQVPVFALTAIGALPLLGAFIRARQLIFMPLNLIGHSIGQMFRSRALAHLKETGSFGPLYDRTLLGLLAVGLPALAVTWVAAPTFFTIYMGPDWTEAGEVIRIIAPLLLLRLLSAPLGSVFNLVGHQKTDFWLHLFSTMGAVLIVGATVLIGGTGVAIITAYTTVASLAYVASIVISRKLAWGAVRSSA